MSMPTFTPQAQPHAVREALLGEKHWPLLTEEEVGFPRGQNTIPPEDGGCAFRQVQSHEGSLHTTWTEPDGLGDDLPPVPAFDPELLPLSLRPMVEDIADRMQVPIDLPAVS